MVKRKGVDKGVLIIALLLLFVGTIILLMRILLSEKCPETNFTISNNSPHVNELVTFSFENPDVRSWEWDFGDSSVVGNHSTETHVYIRPGNYTVKLRINSSPDCDKIAFIEVLPKENKVETVVLLKPEIEGPSMAYVGTPVTFKEISGKGNSWEWFFGETGGVDSKDQNPVYTFREPGSKKVTLIINGNSEVATFDLKVSPKQAAVSSGTPVQKAPLINEEAFKNMLRKIAEREITSQAFDKYINGYFTMPIKVNGKVIEFDSYLKGLGITGDYTVKSVKLKNDKLGYINDIEISE